jgi:membrane protein implicated in regulation of membrane protease activity
MAAQDDERTVRDTISDVSRDFAGLLREELALAKAELRHGFKQFIRGAAFLLVAAFIVNAGFMALVASAVVGLSGGMAVWLSAFIVGLVLAVVGAFLLMRGIDDMRKADLKPDRTIETLREDARIVKERGHE